MRRLCFSAFCYRGSLLFVTRWRWPPFRTRAIHQLSNGAQPFARTRFYELRTIRPDSILWTSRHEEILQVDLASPVGRSARLLLRGSGVSDERNIGFPNPLSAPESRRSPKHDAPIRGRTSE